MKIGDKVRILKNCGRRGEIGTITGKEKVMQSIYTPNGFMWRIEFGNNMPDGLFIPDDFRVIEDSNL